MRKRLVIIAVDITLAVLPVFIYAEAAVPRNTAEQANFVAVGTGATTELQAGLDAYQSGDYRAALKKLIPLANKGVAAAQLRLGVMNEMGQGVPQNYQRAVMRYRQAAEQGNAEAQYNLGRMFDLGQGVPQSKEMAARWYGKSATQGYAEAQAKTAEQASFVAVGIGTTTELQAGLDAYQSGDYRAALKKLIPLANKGDAAAQLRLGMMNEMGQGVPQNYQRAVMRYRQAAEQGNAEAQYNLGRMFDLGQGVPQSKEMAARWYGKSATQGHAEAQAKIAEQTTANTAEQAGKAIVKPATQADEPSTIAALAHEQASRGQLKEAESSYRKALSADPLNASTLSGLIALYRQQGMAAKVQLTIAQLTPAQRNALGASLKHIEATMLQDQADLRLAKGQNDQAIKYLEQAVQVDADDSSLHLKLAKQYARRNSHAMVLTLLDDFLGRHPEDTDVLYALALYQSEQGDPSNALKTLNRIGASQRSHEMLLLQQRLTVNNLGQDTKSLMQSGRKNDALKVLSDAEAISSGNEDLTLAVALVWAEIGDMKHGRALFEKVKAEHTPPSVTWHLRYASLLAMTDSDQELRMELETIAEIQGLSPAEKTALIELQEHIAVRLADKHIMAGNATLAHQTLAPLLKQNPDQAQLLLADARAYRAEHQWQAATDIYRHILKLDTLNSDARKGLIETLAASGDRIKALQQLDEWATSNSANDVYMGLQLHSMLVDFGEYARAKKLVDSLIDAHPEATYVLYDAWKMAQRAGQLDHEIDYLRKLVIAYPSQRNSSSSLRDTLSTQEDTRQMPAIVHENIGIDEFGSTNKIQRDWKEKKLAALIDRRSRWFSSAIDIHSRSGTRGSSQYNSAEIPLEYKTPWHQNDEVFLRVDEIILNAGYVDPTNTSFGSQLLCQPYCSLALSQQAWAGLSLTAGYEQNNLQADIGVTPLNFPVSNIVGGIHHDGDLGKLSYSIEASRRPVTASLLSFAGTQDPRTGVVWGGVVATGGRLGLSLDKGKTFGFWSSAGLHSLTGRNVLSNGRFQLMAGGQWRVINEENRQFSLGLTGMYWHHTQNAGEYTFGHGGYYSPQNYRSLSLPITYSERYPRFSYVVRGAVSSSWSQTQAADYFPTDITMQAKAITLALTNFVTPMYSGGSSSGAGFSLKGAWEYQVEPKLFAGGVLSIDRSDSYSPNRVLFYMRYSLDHPGAQPVFMLPEPIEASSQR